MATVQELAQAAADLVAKINTFATATQDSTEAHAAADLADAKAATAAGAADQAKADVLASNAALEAIVAQFQPGSPAAKL